MRVNLAFREYGAGAPILLLHGLLGSAANWGTVARRLAANRRVLAVDLRNHGRSPHSDDMHYRDMAADVVGLMQRVGLKSAVLLGHSAGGKVAMTLALAHPALVERLVVVDIAPVTYPRTHLDLLAALQGLDLSRVRRRADADSALREHIPDERVRLFVLQNLAPGPEGYAWRVNLEAICRHADAISGFPEPAPGAIYAGPTLFIAGDCSSYLRPEHGAAIHHHFPRAQTVRVPQAGHWVHSDRPDEFVHIVQGFLASHTADLGD